SDRSSVRQVKFSECIITNNRGNGYCGAVLIDSLTKCTINFIDSFFNENSGTEVNDIWIRSTNSQRVIFVSNKTVSGTRDGSRDKPYLLIQDSFPKLNYTSKPVNMPRTIYILDDLWDESLYDVSFANPLTIKSGINDDQNQVRQKVTWITTRAIDVTIYYRTGELTLEYIQFNFSIVSGQVRPSNDLIYINGQNSLTVISCVFNGLGFDGNLVWNIINSYQGKRMILTDSIFQNTNVIYGVVLFNESHANAEFVAQNCQFLFLKSIQSTSWVMQLLCRGYF
ncbi:MAG: hypothetical protein EZS28_043310, partial [Streblomastix strix]